MMRWTMIRVSLAAGWALAVSSEPAWGGTLLARDGKTYAGKVELKAGNQVVVTPASGAAVSVPLQEVVRISMADAVAVPVEAAAADAHLPLPWRQADIGSVKESGSATEDKGVFTLRGAGWGIWGANDSFHFVYRPLVGNGDVVARLGELPTDENPFVAGVTMREGLDPSGTQASVMLFPDGRLWMSCRPIDGSAESAPLSGTNSTQWVRLVRTGDFFSGFCSADGQGWVLVGTVRVRMNATAHVGLACAATLNQAALGTTFEDIKVTAQLPVPAEGVGLVDGSLVAGQTKSLDGESLKYTDGAGVVRSLAAEAVAYIVTRPLPPDVRKAVAERKEGASLVTGDEIEGHIESLRDKRLTVSSVLLGRRTLPLSKVLAAVLRPVHASGGFMVAASDGSIYRCPGLTVDEGVVVAEGGIAGSVSVKAADLVEVNRLDP